MSKSGRVASFDNKKRKDMIRFSFSVSVIRKDHYFHEMWINFTTSFTYPVPDTNW